MTDQVPLFRQHHLSDLERERQEKAHSIIKRMPADEVRWSARDDAPVVNMLEPLNFQAPILLLDSRERKRFEVPADSDNGCGERASITRRFVELLIPFQGDDAMFHVQPPSQVISTVLHASVQRGVIRHVRPLDLRPPEQVENALDTFEREFNATFQALCFDLRAANGRLFSFVKQALDTRRKGL